MTDPENTTADMLLEAAAIGRASGLRYVYAGNLPGQVGDLEDTHCAACREPLVRRYGYYIRDYRISDDGRCPALRGAGPGPLEPRVRRPDRLPAFLPGHPVAVEGALVVTDL